MTHLLRATYAELLKLRRTLAFRVVFLFPFLVGSLEFFVVWRTKRFPSDFHLWDTVPKTSFQVWAIFMMPLLITLETALLNGIEHSDKQWKHIFALPIPRQAVYLSKFIVAQALILTSTIVLAILVVIVGVAGTYMRVELANAGAPPIGFLAKYTALVWIAGWFIIAIHTWISMRWSGFPIALGAGIGGTFFALFAASAAIGKYYPWLLPVNLFQDGRFTTAIVLGATGGVLGAALGCVEFVRRDVT